MFLTAYCEGGVVPLPLGEAAGGQGVPDGVVPVPGCELPEVLVPLFPAVEGDEFEDSEFDDSEFADPEFDVPGVAAPGAGVELLGVPAVPGNGPHGEPPGVVPGVVCVFGFTVEGCVLLPGVGGAGEFDPGTLPGC